MLDKVKEEKMAIDIELKNIVKKFCLRLIGVKNPYSRVEDENKVIYVHIPKTGGNAVMSSLFNCPGVGHEYIDEYYRFNRYKFNRYFKFAIVRNPYTRFNSAFNYLKKGGISESDIKYMKPMLESINNVDDFVDALRSDAIFYFNVMNYVHFVPQSNFLTSTCKIRGVTIDYIGKQEELGDSIKELGELLKLDNVKPKSVNVTSSYDKHLSENVKSFVSEHYAKDFEILGYSK
ncbi:sulfotransferase family 2 domain-containing protein [Vibrio toranzoniae]|uniref:sulfotransferase family 2 domain-containing protein n=1 Tax=Vibrio toranzoniae TaxID=1194427 RepID=UPI001378ECE8|nr:sulfotransferase family 2 domain-containing protein [Vibrio toranzoniae]NAZ70745.1 sulfotransferase family 2 domain-containing protein [Vibrio toranzoniae]